MKRNVFIFATVVLGSISVHANLRELRSDMELMGHVMAPFKWEDLESFSNVPPNYHASNSLDDVYFYLYRNPTEFGHFHKIKWNDQASMQQLPWYEGAPVKILIHGFTQSQNSSMPAMVKNAYLENMQKSNAEKVNVITVDWGRLAGSTKSFPLSTYSRAVRNVEVAGKRVGELICKLKEFGIISSYDKVHIIGFSLGAHVAGWAGSTVKKISVGKKVGRLTGLDPAGPFFYVDGFKGRFMKKTDAKFTDVIHTSWGSYGMAKKLGDADFYPNYEFQLPIETQPHCLRMLGTHRPLQVCSHNMAPVFFSMSILKNIQACKCRDFLFPAVTKKFCKLLCSEKASFGEQCDNSEQGDFYLDIPHPILREEESAESSSEEEHLHSRKHRAHSQIRNSYFRYG